MLKETLLAASVAGVVLAGSRLASPRTASQLPAVPPGPSLPAFVQKQGHLSSRFCSFYSKRPSIPTAPQWTFLSQTAFRTEPKEELPSVPLAEELPGRAPRRVRPHLVLEGEVVAVGIGRVEPAAPPHFLDRSDDSLGN